MIPWPALAAAYLLDGWMGDPPHFPHPVRWIGTLITWLEGLLRRVAPPRPLAQIAAGGVLVVLVVSVTAAAAWALVAGLRLLHPWLGTAASVLGVAVFLARRSLSDAVRAVYAPLAAGELAAAREAVAETVGRDTHQLDQHGVARAAIESVAENTSDGVTAPLFYALIGGLPLMAAYKAINTLDSMLGYRSERYLYFGRVAARLDDLANWIPAHLTGLAFVGAAALLGMDWARAWSVLRADGRSHPSPNSGWPEAALAGAMGVRLGGISHYAGIPSHRPTICADGNAPAAQHLMAGLRLVQTTCHLFLIVGILAREVIGR